MKRSKYLIMILLLLAHSLIFAGCAGKTNSEKEPINLTISAAASLTDVMEELKVLFEEQYDMIMLTMNYGASGALQNQIEQGAPVDVFISAAQTQMNALAEIDLIMTETRLELLENVLVLIAPTDTGGVESFESLSHETVTKIGIGEPESVPAGRYAKEVFTTLNVWDRLESKLVLGKDVRQVLTWVETGNVDAGIVYMTDALTADVNIIIEAPAGSHASVIYPAAVVANTSHMDAASTFLNFLTSSDASEVFVSHGFKTISGE